MRRAFAFGDKTLEPAVRRVNEVRCVAVIGAGTMGQGIAIDLLRKTDHTIVLLDVQAAALARAEARLTALWQEQVKTSRLRAEDARALAARTRYTQKYEELREADIIWEAATERSEIKARIFQCIEQFADPLRLAAVFSNTSSHTTAELAVLFQSEALREKFLTVHGYYPFEANRLIDVMKGKYASAETFAFGVVFADQILEKTVIALPVDHHGYLTDPIFQAMGAILSWDLRCGQDIVALGGLWELFTANPFNVLDQTGHMPYTESSRHLGTALPETDRLRNLYNRDGRHYPDWIARLEQAGRTGVNSPSKQGFYAWTGDPPKPTAVLDPASGAYVPIGEISRKEFWSYYEAAEQDRRAGKIKSADGLVHVACAADAGGRAFRRYALPILLYGLDLIQDRVATPGQINAATRAGLRYKVGLIEAVDAFIAQLTIDGLLELVRRARDENADDPAFVELLDVDGLCGPRRGRPSLLHELRKRNITRLLGYGEFFRTPVAELDLDTGQYRGCYLDLKFVEPSSRDRVASIVFNNPLRGNVWNRALLDQLAHAYRRVLRLHREGRCGAVLFTAAGAGMRMLGADAREFNRGWFERAKGYAPLSEAEAAAFTKHGMRLFRLIQRSPVASLGVFGEKWGGGAEFSYFLDLRYDVRAEGFVYDSLERQSRWQPKNTYNQPELDFAILGGFGAAGELKRLGLGDSVIFELFDQGLTADRAYQVGLCNGVFDDELEALRRGYERARLMAKDAPYSRALFKQQLARGIDDEALVRETGEVFNPQKNPFVKTGLLALLDRGAGAPKMDYACRDTRLPGWTYPAENGTAEMDATHE
ncbi:MAG: 3-hydroxyacyl-CoA dehydrogenase NAD-binding domain-containing protein [Planctomycetota bacterium]